MASNLFILLLLVLSAISASLAWNVSIDCGTSESYIDEYSIQWTGDSSFMKNGESQEVEHSYRPMNSLRVFSTRKKNCYSIKTKKRRQFLVRASFLYGNYDLKESPPTFELHFDGNYWDTVVTQIDQVVSYEAIYVPKGDAISVCVAQTQRDQLPFISALEVRSMGLEMYRRTDENSALFLKRRVAFGALIKPVRYPDDVYDRIWNTEKVVKGLIPVKSDLHAIDINVEDNPPTAVLLNAITTPNTSTTIVFGTNLPEDKVPIYINMYFAEVAEAAVLNSTRNRSIELYVDNALIIDPFIPPYGSVSEKFIQDMTASSETSFVLQANSNSTLPPLINALEVFTVSDSLTDGTNSQDVEGLASLQSKFDILNEWNGDPCLPASYTWDWVTCGTDTVPRVTALNLGGYGLTGSLPDFSSMIALQTIDLHNNSLSGTIPDFLGTLPNLEQLNLADNQFSGLIPSSLSNNKKLNLVTSGNPNLNVFGKSHETSDTGPSPGSSRRRFMLPAILGATISTFIIFWDIYYI